MWEHLCLPDIKDLPIIPAALKKQTNFVDNWPGIGTFRKPLIAAVSGYAVMTNRITSKRKPFFYTLIN